MTCDPLQKMYTYRNAVVNQKYVLVINFKYCIIKVTFEVDVPSI